MSAALKLEIYQNGEFVNEIPCDHEELWIGRNVDCVIRLEDRAISRRHGSLKLTPEGVDFEKKSKFGSARVNGKEIEQASLKGGDRLEMGPYEIRVRAEVPPPLAVAPEPPVPALSVAEIPENEDAVEFAQDAGLAIDFRHPEGVEAITIEPNGADGMGDLGNSPEAEPAEKSANFDFAQVQADGATKVIENTASEMKAVLQFSDGDANVTAYEITGNEVAIGRSQKCHVVLEDKRSSRKHSLIRREGKKFSVKDLGSANGTLINGIRVEEQELHSGDVVQIGETKFTFQLLQNGYEAKKEQFIQLPPEERASEMPHASMQSMPQMMSMDASQQFQRQQYQQHQAFAKPTAAPDFSAPAGPKKSFIGKFLDRYRAMNTKQQIIYGAVILVVVYYMLDDDAPEKKPKLNMGQTNHSAQVQKKPGKKGSTTGPTFETLTPEQQRYIETEYQLSFDFYKNREYDSALLEVGKIFSLVQDFKNAREIETFAREGKRKLEAQEEERKKKDLERQAQLKLQTLLEQAGMLMEKKKYNDAETLFPEIELLQPENAAVGAWRKEMIAEKEKIEKALQEKKQMEAANKMAWEDFEKAKSLAKDKKYWDALDAYDDLVTRVVSDAKFVPAVQEETKRVEDTIAGIRDPLYAQGKELEQNGKLSEAYRAYQQTLEIDPLYSQASEGMKRIRGMVTGKAKVIYSEGVFAESFSDWDTAEKKYREVMEVVPNDDPYFLKAQSRLKKLMIFKQPVPVTSASTGSGTDLPQ